MIWADLNEGAKAAKSTSRLGLRDAASLSADTQLLWQALPLLSLLCWMKAVWQSSQPSLALIDEVSCSVANACVQLILKY